MSADVIRVVIADDEPLIRTGIATVLASAGDIAVVAEAGDGRSTVNAVRTHRPDVAVLDIRMPVLDGLGVLTELRGVAPSVRAVMLTSFGLEENVLRAVEHGAAGFILKNCTPPELISAVRAAHGGDAYLAPAVTRMVLDLVSPVDVRRRQDAAERLRTLTAREADVLRLVAEGRSNAEIGRRLRMTESTIKTYVSRVLTKLQCASRVQAALLARDAAPTRWEP